MRITTHVDGETSRISYFLNPGSGSGWITSGLWVCLSPSVPSRLVTNCLNAATQYFGNSWTLGVDPSSNTSFGCGGCGPSVDVKVNYCLSEGIETPDDDCSLQFSTSLMIVVCIANVLKCFCIWFTALTLRRNPLSTLTTVGDAIAAFLQIPDPNTEGYCLVSSKEWNRTEKGPRKALLWDAQQSRWFQATSTKRRLRTMSFYVFCSVIVPLIC